MAFLVYFGTFLALVCQALPQFSMEEMMEAFSDIDNPHSVVLTSENFQVAFANNSGPWFVFFAEPRSFQSVIKNPVWMIFGSTVKEKGLKVNLGTVDMSKEIELKKRFRISSFPVFFYFEGGFFYNYSGPSEPEDFEKVVEEKLYVQYDRQVFEIVPHDENLLKSFRREFLKNPALFILGTFFSSLIGLFSFSWFFCNKPKKSEAKQPENQEEKKKVH
jgi:hypothetical protein